MKTNESNHIMSIFSSPVPGSGETESKIVYIMFESPKYPTPSTPVPNDLVKGYNEVTEEAKKMVKKGDEEDVKLSFTDAHGDKI